MKHRALTITAEVGNAIYIGDAIQQAVELAKQLNCNIEFAFNGKKLIARPDSDPGKMLMLFEKEIGRD